MLSCSITVRGSIACPYTPRMRSKIAIVHRLNFCFLYWLYWLALEPSIFLFNPKYIWQDSDKKAYIVILWIILKIFPESLSFSKTSINFMNIFGEGPPLQNVNVVYNRLKFRNRKCDQYGKMRLFQLSQHVNIEIIVHCTMT